MKTLLLCLVVMVLLLGVTTSVAWASDATVSSLTAEELRALAKEYPNIEYNPYASFSPLTEIEARSQLESLTALMNSLSQGLLTDIEIPPMALPPLSDSLGTRREYRACLSVRDLFYGDIRHDAYLQVDNQSNTFTRLESHTVVPHLRNIPLTDLQFVQHSQYDYAQGGLGWRLGVSGTLYAYVGPWVSTIPFNGACTVRV